jgi:diguanylate cyclase (GGDEF)-like protein
MNRGTLVPSTLRTRLLLLAGVLAIAGAVWLVSAAQRDAATRTQAQERAAARMLTTMLEQESGLRGFLNTRDASFLEPYERGRDEFDAAMTAALTSTHADDALAIAAIRRHVSLARRWQQLAEDRRFAVAERGAAGFSQADARSRKALMDRFRAENGRYQELLARRRSSELTRAGRLSVGVVVLLALLFGGLGYLLVERRERTARRERTRSAEYVASQAEFTSTLQVMRSEGEAHALVGRHLGRTIPGANVLVLNRNNSDDRLEPKSELDPASPLAEPLRDAAPSACMAIRLARPHERGGETEPLLECSLCGKLAGASLCVPSVVGGEVIGSVLVTRERPLGEHDAERVRESVAHAAPALANLRNLEIAELRASTDALTGLANQRAVRETLKRMVAQAARAVAPLGAIMLDLDHFKQVNDVYGHGCGDDVLAAVGAALAETIRDSDFAGRWGGEEFLALLPGTDRAGAAVVAEKLRLAIERIHVQGVDRAVTASFGVAALPEDAGDGDSLVRLADRALYAAKAGGRNRVVLAERHPEAQPAAGA